MLSNKEKELHVSINKSDKDKVRDVILVLIKHHTSDTISDLYVDIPKWLWSDYHFLIKAVRYRPHCLKYASQDLKNNYDIVNEAIQVDKDVIQYASKQLQEDVSIFRSKRKRRTS